MNTPTLTTERLILRRFTGGDLGALFRILKDGTVNEFLPWYPVKDMAETKQFYEERYAAKYARPRAYAYAICLKGGGPIGYINVDTEEPYDLGYGLLQGFWHRGIVTEAARAVIEQLKKDALRRILQCSLVPLCRDDQRGEQRRHIHGECEPDGSLFSGYEQHQGDSAAAHRRQSLPARRIWGQLRLLKCTPGTFMRNPLSATKLRSFSS